MQPSNAQKYVLPHTINYQHVSIAFAKHFQNTSVPNNTVTTALVGFIGKFQYSFNARFGTYYNRYVLDVVQVVLQTGSNTTARTGYVAV
jgi:hypothetical protein